MPPRYSSTFSPWLVSPAWPPFRQSGRLGLVRASTCSLRPCSSPSSRSDGIRHLRLNSRHVSLCFHAGRPRRVRETRQTRPARPSTQGSTRRFHSHRNRPDLQSSHRVRCLFASFSPAIHASPSFIVTISAWTEPGCKNAANDPNADRLGDNFKAALPGWCSTKKAGAIFFWLAFGQFQYLQCNRPY